MKKASAPHENEKIAAAALRIAATGGWVKVTLAAVAKASKLPLAAVQKKYPTANDLVGVIAADIDRVAFAACGAVSATPHDALFDVLMARFDILQKHRAAILSMAEAARQDRGLTRALACATLEGIYRIIDEAALATPPRPALVAGIGAIYGYAFWVWRKDVSRDMAKTMAAVDRALRWAGKAARFITPNA